MSSFQEKIHTFRKNKILMRNPSLKTCRKLANFRVKENQDLRKLLGQDFVNFRGNGKIIWRDWGNPGGTILANLGAKEIQGAGFWQIWGQRKSWEQDFGKSGQ